MDAKHRLKKYVYHLLVAIDQLFNALTGGAADETLSSRTYRGARLAQKPKTRWKVLYTLINGVFFDRQHCRQAYISELKGRQHDARFQPKPRRRGKGDAMNYFGMVEFLRLMAMVRPPFVFFSGTRSELPTYLDLVAELRLTGWERFAGSQTLTVSSTSTAIQATTTT